MPRILVVDDEPHVRELIATLLRLEGYEVEVAGDGIAALRACEQRIPDLIVLDLAMPEMDGWRFLEEIYRRGLRRRTRVVIVSAWIDEDERDVSVRHKLMKPFAPEALTRTVADALEQEPDALYEQRERTASLSRLLSKIDQTLS